MPLFIIPNDGMRQKPRMYARMKAVVPSFRLGIRPARQDMVERIFEQDGVRSLSGRLEKNCLTTAYGMKLAE